MSGKEWMAKRGADFWTGLFLMVFSGWVINGALELELGTPNDPGSGFIIFGAAILLGGLATHQFIRALLLRQDRATPAPAREETRRLRVLAVVVANILYIALLESLGYVLCTFLLITFMLQVYEYGKWIWAVGGGILASSLTYLLFSRLLHVNLPNGLIFF